MEIFYVAIYSYILGSIPFGLIYSNILGYGDIRKIGSGNIGATNALRTGSKLLAALTLMSDILKGSAAVYITLKYFSEFAYFSAITVYLGHIFPIWLKFKGGKGVATYIGNILILNPVLFVIYGLSWLIIAKLFKISSISALIAFLIIIPCSYFFYDLNITYLNFFFFIFSIYTHRENIKRLIAGTEK